MPEKLFASNSGLCGPFLGVPQVWVSLLLDPHPAVKVSTTHYGCRDGMLSIKCIPPISRVVTSQRLKMAHYMVSLRACFMCPTLAWQQEAAVDEHWLGPARLGRPGQLRRLSQNDRLFGAQLRSHYQKMPNLTMPILKKAHESSQHRVSTVLCDFSELLCQHTKVFA